jgi:hypothetical protein
MTNKLSPKAQAVKKYEKHCPQKLKAYVTKTLKYESCKDWSFEELADEFGIGYMMYWDEKLQELMACTNQPDENMHDLTRLTN